MRFSSIGDIVLCSPVMRCLKSQTALKVHFLTKKTYGDLVRGNPHVDRVYTIEKSVSEVVEELRDEHYDHIIDLHKNLRSAELQVRLGKTALSFDKRNLEKWVMTSFLKARRQIDHIVMRYLQAVKPLGVSYDGQGLDFFLPKDLDPEITAFKSPNVCFAIGGAHGTKRLPAAKIIEICKGLKLPVLLLGGKGDIKAAEAVVQATDTVISFCGQLTIEQSAWMIKNAKLLITHDTGMMHIAAAMQKPIISIWGNTVPEFGMYPFYPSDKKLLSYTSEVKNLSCRPCSKIGYERCPKGHFRCMEWQDTAEIIDMADSLLSDFRHP